MHFDQNDVLIECSDGDKWHKEDKWALMKGKNKRATKVYDNLADAETALASFNNLSTKPAMRVDHRVGENTRCEGNFCGVAEKCPMQMDVVAQRILDKLTVTNGEN